MNQDITYLLAQLHDLPIHILSRLFDGQVYHILHLGIVCAIASLPSRGCKFWDRNRTHCTGVKAHLLVHAVSLLDNDVGHGLFKDICTQKTNDGLVFLPESVHANEMRADADYAGIRVILLGKIDGARCQIQIDIGYGDAVTPGPIDAEYPTMQAEFDAPKLRVYPHYTVVAEKFEALATLGIANSRMKDYFDLWILSLNSDFEGDILRQAIQATFNRRTTTLTRDLPFGLTHEFALDPQKKIQWKAFIRKNQLEAISLVEVVDALTIFLQPVLAASSKNKEFPSNWTTGGHWESVSEN